MFSTPLCALHSGATCFGILTCGDLQIPVLLHKHRRHPESELWPRTSPADFRQNTSAGSLYTRCAYPILCIDLCQTAALVTPKITKAGPRFTFGPMNYHLIFPKQEGFVPDVQTSATSHRDREIFFLLLWGSINGCFHNIPGYYESNTFKITWNCWYSTEIPPPLLYQGSPVKFICLMLWLVTWKHLW